MEDEILRQIREARKKLLSKHGSFKAYIKHLQVLDGERLAQQMPNHLANKMKRQSKSRSRRSA